MRSASRVGITDSSGMGKEVRSNRLDVSLSRKGKFSKSLEVFLSCPSGRKDRQRECYLSSHDRCAVGFALDKRTLWAATETELFCRKLVGLSQLGDAAKFGNVVANWQIKQRSKSLDLHGLQSIATKFLQSSEDLDQYFARRLAVKDSYCRFCFPPTSHG